MFIWQIKFIHLCLQHCCILNILKFKNYIYFSENQFVIKNNEADRFTK